MCVKTKLDSVQWGEEVEATHRVGALELADEDAPVRRQHPERLVEQAREQADSVLRVHGRGGRPAARPPRLLRSQRVIGLFCHLRFRERAHTAIKAWEGDSGWSRGRWSAAQSKTTDAQYRLGAGIQW